MTKRPTTRKRPTPPSPPKDPLAGGLVIGKYILGPDDPGCCNSGIAPAILRSTRHNDAYKRGLTKIRYVVGKQMVVEEFLEQRHWLDNLTGVRVWKSKRYPKAKDFKVYLYETAAPAKAKFRALCQAQVDKRKQVAAKHAELTNKAKSGHPDDVMALVFHAMDN